MQNAKCKIEENGKGMQNAKLYGKFLKMLEIPGRLCYNKPKGRERCV